MLQKPESSASAASPPVPAQGLDELYRQLKALGFGPRLLVSGHGVMSGGLALRLELDQRDDAPVHAADVLARLRRALLQRVPVTLTLAAARAPGTAALERALERLAAVASVPCIDRSRLGIAVYAGETSLPAFERIGRVLLGAGPRYLFIDAVMGEDRAGGADAVWSRLFAGRRRAAAVVPVYGGGARSRCPLLADEATGAILPQRAILVPAGTAWLPLDLDLGRFSDGRGVLREAQLERALERGLGIADRLLDRLCWPERSLANDAWLNRRIAVTLHGIGDLVAASGADPADVNCLGRYDRLLSRVHHHLWNRSHRLAAERGLLPALDHRNPSRSWPDGRHRRDWQRRWQEALATDAVRHRNLLVLSPYGLLPRSGAACPSYTELTPLLAHADAVSFAGRAVFTGWSVNEFKQFHRRAHAAIERRNATSFIAAGA